MKHLAALEIRGCSDSSREPKRRAFWLQAQGEQESFIIAIYCVNSSSAVAQGTVHSPGPGGSERGRALRSSGPERQGLGLGGLPVELVLRAESSHPWFLWRRRRGNSHSSGRAPACVPGLALKLSSSWWGL